MRAATRTIAWLWLAWLAAGQAGCSSGSPVVSLAPPPQPPPASEYHKLRDRWTRGHRIIKTLDTPLLVNATLFSPEFAAVYLSKRTEMFKLSAAERASLERQLREDAGSSYFFFVGATGTDYNWIDFERPNSIWHITLMNDTGDQVTVARIDLERHPNATVTELFPYVGVFHRAYTIRFPLTLSDGRPLLRPDSQRLRLIFAGPLGHAELVWRLR